MPLNKDKNILFIHIPKCAGTTVEKHIGFDSLKSSSNIYLKDNVSYSLQHLTIDEIKKVVGIETYEKCYKFTFIRNPYERVLSEYFWRTKKEKFDNKDFFVWFNDFFENVDVDHKLKTSDYLLDDKENIYNLNKIGRVENFNNDFLDILNDLNINNKNFKIKNKSNNKRSYLDLLNIENKENIYKYFQKDFEKFNYKK